MNKNFMVPQGDIFTKSKHTFILNEIFQYFDLKESLRLGNINSLVFNYIKKYKPALHIQRLNLLCKSQGLPNLHSVESCMKKLLMQGNNEIPLDLIQEYLCYIIVRNILTTGIIDLNGETTSMTRLEVFESIEAVKNYLSPITGFLYYNIHLNSKRSQVLIKKFLTSLPNLLTLEVVNNNLNEDFLEYVNRYLENEKCKISVLDLRYNNIGTGENSLKLLKLIIQSKSLRNIYFDGCKFTNSTIPLIIEAYESSENFISNLIFKKNDFTLEFLIDLFQKRYGKMGKECQLKFSIKRSPEYFFCNGLRGMRLNHIGRYIKSQTEEYYNKYVRDFYFERLTIGKIRLEETLTPELIRTILENKSADIIHLNILIDNLPIEILTQIKNFVSTQETLRSLLIQGLEKESENSDENVALLEKANENKGIRFLHIANISYYANKWIEYLCKMIESNQINRLYLSRCSIIGNDEMILLSNSIKNCSSISTFIIKECSYDYNIAVEVFNNLKSQPTIKYLRIEYENISLCEMKNINDNSPEQDWAEFYHFKDFIF